MQLFDIDKPGALLFSSHWKLKSLLTEVSMIQHVLTVRSSAYDFCYQSIENAFQISFMKSLNWALQGGCKVILVSSFARS